MMGEIDGYRFETEPFEKTEIFTIYNVVKDGVHYKARIFKKDAVQRYNLETVVEYNKEVFWYMGKYSNMLTLKEFSFYEQGEIHYFQNYQCSLRDYIQQKPINEAEAIEILKDIMRAVYNMFDEGYYPLNIRPEHFVLVKNKWKLRSLVFDQEHDKYLGIESEFVWDSRRQVLEAYQRTEPMSEKQLQESLVWDIGSIMLNVVKSVHQLISYQKIKKLHSNGFGLQHLNLPKLASLISRCLDFGSLNRLKLKELFEYPLFKGEFDTKKLGVNIHNSSSNISTLKFKYEMSQIRQKSILQKSVHNQQTFKKSFIMRKQERVSDQHQALGGSQQFANLLSGELQMISKVQHKKGALEAGSMFRKKPQQEVDEIRDNRFVKAERKQPQVSPLRSTFQIGQITESVRFTAHPDSWSLPPEQQKQNPRRLSFEKERKFLYNYKQQVDKVELCSHVSNLIRDVPFKKCKEYWITVAKFALEFQATIRIRQLVLALNSHTNILKFDLDDFEQFSRLPCYGKLQQLCNDLLQNKTASLQNLRTIAQKINIASFTDLNKPTLFQEILRSNINQMTVQKLKPFYKMVLCHCYQVSIQDYNVTQNFDIIVLNMFILLTVSLDKIFVQENIPQNWAQLFKWQNKKPSTTIQLNDVIDYMNRVERLKLRDHLWNLAKRWFNLTNDKSRNN